LNKLKNFSRFLEDSNDRMSLTEWQCNGCRGSCEHARRSKRVLRTFRRCRWKKETQTPRPKAWWPCTRDWRWPSTPWTRLKSVLVARISSSLSMFAAYLFIYCLAWWQ